MYNVHYMPPDWAGNAHTTRVRDEFSNLFHYKLVGIYNVHYMPADWAGNAHTTRVRDKFSNLFHYKLVGIACTMCTTCPQTGQGTHTQHASGTNSQTSSIINW